VLTPEDEQQEDRMSEFPETHRQGFVQIHNQDLIDTIDLHDCDLGVQIATDGRVWVCINGVAFLRFKPAPRPGGGR
jgi:hypothetical protein